MVQLLNTGVAIRAVNCSPGTVKHAGETVLYLQYVRFLPVETVKYEPVLKADAVLLHMIV